MNFMFAQDAMDLISGHYSVNKNSPFQVNGFESVLVSNNNVFISYTCRFCYLLVSTSRKVPTN